LNVNSEGESAQLTDQETAGEVLRAQMHAESRKNYDAAAEKYNPDAKYICPNLVYTEEEKADIEHQQTAVGDYFRKSRTDFALGNMDPNSDSDWKKYVDTLWDLGLQDWLDVAQVAYDRG
jgi:putative aldouronate transport system substrate-binding protein